MSAAGDVCAGWTRLHSASGPGGGAPGSRFPALGRPPDGGIWVLGRQIYQELSFVPAWILSDHNIFLVHVQFGEFSKEKVIFLKMMYLHLEYSTVKINSWCLSLLHTAHLVPFTGNSWFFLRIFFYLTEMQMQAERDTMRCFPYSTFGWDLVVCHYWWLQCCLCFRICSHCQIAWFQNESTRRGCSIFIYRRGFLGVTGEGEQFLKLFCLKRQLGCPCNPGVTQKQIFPDHNLGNVGPAVLSNHPGPSLYL